MRFAKLTLAILAGISTAVGLYRTLRYPVDEEWRPLTEFLRAAAHSGDGVAFVPEWLAGSARDRDRLRGFSIVSFGEAQELAPNADLWVYGDEGALHALRVPLRWPHQSFIELDASAALLHASARPIVPRDQASLHLDRARVRVLTSDGRVLGTAPLGRLDDHGPRYGKNTIKGREHFGILMTPVDGRRLEVSLPRFRFGDSLTVSSGLVWKAGVFDDTPTSLTVRAGEDLLGELEVSTRVGESVLDSSRVAGLIAPLVLEARCAGACTRPLRVEARSGPRARPDPEWARLPSSRHEGEATLSGSPLAVPKFSAPPNLDGALTDDVWRDAAEMGPLGDPQSGAADNEDWVSAFAKVGWDDRALYLGAVVRDPAPTSPFRRQDVDSHVWTKSSAIEIMLQPGDLGDNRDYYELQIDVNGAVWDTHFDDYNQPITGEGTQRRFGHQEWSSDTERAIFVAEGRFYSIELAIPWRSFETKRVAVPPRKGDVWRINLYSFRDGQKLARAWSPLRGQGNFHKASRFGRVRFE